MRRPAKLHDDYKCFNEKLFSVIKRIVANKLAILDV